MTLSIVQTEKAFNLQSEGVYVLSLKDSKLNKIKLKQVLTKAGITPLKISIVSANFKVKRKGKISKKVKIFTSKKAYIKLNKKDSITEEKIQEINKLLTI